MYWLALLIQITAIIIHDTYTMKKKLHTFLDFLHIQNYIEPFQLYIAANIEALHLIQNITENILFLLNKYSTHDSMPSSIGQQKSTALTIRKVMKNIHIKSVFQFYQNPALLKTSLCFWFSLSGILPLLIYNELLRCFIIIQSDLWPLMHCLPPISFSWIRPSADAQRDSHIHTLKDNLQSFL